MRVYFEFYGCTANKYDACLINGVLKKNGYEIVEEPDEADVIVLATCTVIDTTEQRMLSRLREFKKTGKKIVVTGCMASVQSELVKKVCSNAQILPPDSVHQIVNLLKNKEVVKKRVDKTRFFKHYNSLSAPVLISEGCRFSCSYCITTLARGELRSYPENGIVDDIKNALLQGCKEIQLTSQDTASYGVDRQSSLAHLLKKISAVKGDYRIRIGMMNPRSVLENIDLIVESFNYPQVYKFLHLPVQSGDNEILKKMRRGYTVEEFNEIVEKFRKKYPDMTISTDVIVGFPSETDEKFQKTIDLIKKIKPDITNITRFSARPFTDAKKLVGRVKTETVKKRSKTLSEFTRRLSEEKNKKLIGREYTALILSKDKNQVFFGRTENYKPVIIKEPVEIGGFYPVEIVDAKSNYLTGNLK